MKKKIALYWFYLFLCIWFYINSIGYHLFKLSHWINDWSTLKFRFYLSKVKQYEQEAK